MFYAGNVSVKSQNLTKTTYEAMMESNFKTRCKFIGSTIPPLVRFCRFEDFHEPNILHYETRNWG